MVIYKVTSLLARTIYPFVIFKQQIELFRQIQFHIYFCKDLISP